MPWKIKRSGDPWCSRCKSEGLVKCPSPHRRQPPNQIDTETGEPFFMCPTCDWADGNGESGTVRCPECEEFSRDDTFTGDESLQDIECDDCGKKGATLHTIPDHLLDSRARRRRANKRYSHPDCHTQAMIAAQERHEANLRLRAYLAAGGPVGTCDGCHEIDAIEPLDGDRYLCEGCGGNPYAILIPQQRDGEADDGPAAGWYDDPEHPGLARYWTGAQWVGTPTDPAHIT